MNELEDTMAWAMREASELTHRDCVPLARAALSAIEAAGYVVVPREPTQAMIDSGYTHPGMCEPGDPEWVWQAMISAVSEGK